MFRKICGNKKLPILLGELGYFSKTSHEPFMEINRIMHEHAQHDKNSGVIVTKGLDHKGDQLHFNAAGQRAIGRMFAELYASKWL
jgi:lysophospholipase L1-like esterase